VYTARVRSLGSRVAIKILPPEVAASDIRIARFRREAAVAANLSHPNIVPVFEFDASPGLAYLVMPFVEGQTLAAQLAEHQGLEYPAVRKLIGEVGGALAFAHRNGVVHRDIKPANIIQEEATGRWLVTDFGIAHSTRPDDTDITQTGVVIGTPAYMPPEQALGSGVDHRSDLYSLAAVAFQALCGIPINSLADFLVKGKTEIERTIRRAVPHLKPALAAALASPLAPLLEDRPESVAAWLEAIEQAEGTKTLYRWAWVAAAVALIIAVLVLVWPQPSAPPARTPAVAVLPAQINMPDDPNDLATILPPALDRQLAYLPGYRVLGPSVRQEIAKRYGNTEQDIDTLLTVAANLNATVALRSSAEARNDSVILRALLYDVETRQLIRPAEAKGPFDTLDSLVKEIVFNALAEQAMQQTTGYRASLPRGLEAFSSYFQGVIQYRRGSYQRAVELFDRVIELDPEFAPAHFNRMMALIFGNRISRYPTLIDTALQAASAYRERLDPLEQRLLAGYETLLEHGDIWQAEEVASEIVADNPDAVDAQFLLGYVQLNFRALLGRSVREAILPFSKAVEGDSSFAMALWHLATIATVEGDKAAAQDYFARLFAVDSTSMWAVAAQLGDSVVFKGTVGHVVQSISERSTDVVELISVWLGELNPPPGTHAVGEAALQEFRRRAATERDRRLAFRMYMANMLATGKFASAETLLRDGPGRRVPQDELDRWVVLSAVTPIHTLGSPTEVAESARRLLATQEDAESRWLAARWYLSNSTADARPATQSLEQIANDPNRSTPLARSLAKDLEAVRYLALGDTTAADSLWREATRFYSVDDLMFGLTASLWPLRLQQAATAAARGDTAAVLRTAATFQQMAGFVDQVGWPTILPLEAALDPLRARDIYIRLERLLSLADGEGEQLLEQVQRNLAGLGG